MQYVQEILNLILKCESVLKCIIQTYEKNIEILNYIKTYAVCILYIVVSISFAQYINYIEKYVVKKIFLKYYIIK